MRRCVTLFLALLLMCGCLAGCTSGEIDSTTPTPAQTPAPAQPSGVESTPAAEPNPESLGGVFPIVTDGSVTLSIWYRLGDDILAYIQDLANGENYAWSEAIKNTGINVKFVHVASSATTEKFQLMITSGDYTDIINMGSRFYVGGPTKGVEDGVFIELDRYLIDENLAPNYMRWVNKNELDTKYAKTDAGHYVAMCQIYDRSQPQYYGYGIRGDWLADLNMELPTTIDEWHEMLVAFKEEKTGGIAPMELQTSGVPGSQFFIGAFGAAGNPYFIQQNGVVHFSAIEQSYRNYLELMSTWYKEGLIDPDFTTNGGSGFEPNKTRVSLGQSGAVPMMYTYAGDYMARAGIVPEGATFEIAPIPKLNENDPLLVNQKNYNTVTGVGANVSTACKNPDYAVRFMDYFYSDEGMFLANYGIEGITFNYNDEGKPMHTDLIAKNPDGMNTVSAQTRYLIHSGFVVFILDREEDAQSEAALKYRERWAGIGEYNLMGNLDYTAEEGAERSAILNDINTLVEEFTLSVIIGKRELNDATWNEFVGMLEQQNINRAIELTQNAYDRFIAR